MLSTMLDVVVRNVRDAILILVPKIPGKSKSQNAIRRYPNGVGLVCREFRWSGFGPKVWPRPYGPTALRGGHSREIMTQHA